MSVSESLKIEIRPIPNRKGIRSFSENLEYFAKFHTISCLVDPVTRKYKTGLTDEDKKYLEEKGCPYDINDLYIRGQAHPFWESLIAKVNLKPTPDFLYPGRDVLDFIKYKYLLQSKFVYSSEAEMLSGVKPEATHYIYNESEEIAIKATKIERQNFLIKKVSSLSLARKKELLLVILGENMENKNEEYVTVKFNEIIANKEQSSLLETLLEQSKESVTIAADVKKAISTNVLRKTKNGILFFETVLGYTEEDVVELLSKPDNNELYINIKSKID